MCICLHGWDSCHLAHHSRELGQWHETVQLKLQAVLKWQKLAGFQLRSSATLWACYMAKYIILQLTGWQVPFFWLENQRNNSWHGRAGRVEQHLTPLMAFALFSEAWKMGGNVAYPIGFSLFPQDNYCWPGPIPKKTLERKTVDTLWFALLF